MLAANWWLWASIWNIVLSLSSLCVLYLGSILPSSTATIFGKDFTRLLFVVIWMKMTSIGSYIWLLIHQLVELFGKEVGPWQRRYVNKGGFWGFKSPCHTVSSLSLSLCLLSFDQDVEFSASALLPCLSASCCDDHRLTTTICKEHFLYFGRSSSSQL